MLDKKKHTKTKSNQPNRMINFIGKTPIATDFKSCMVAQHFNTKVVKVFVNLVILFITFFHILVDK